MQKCELRFGKDYTYEQIEENVKKSLEYYGGDKPYKGSNAIISNSDLDPWSGQGVEKAESDTVKIFIIRNATHCDDLRAGNNADVLEARPLYIAEIRKWLKGSSHRQSISVFTIILTCITLVAKLF
uniref:Lysosomal Pro-X carboxypeptidase n=1 Tax=Bursaphelenchus xylophilus TaxID=6326 RepID=A0A1I7SHC9_BURXY